MSGRLLLLVTIAMASMGTGRAVADTTFVPIPDNGEKVYLSQACHNGQTSNCQENTGCLGHMGENAWSDVFADATLRDATGSGGLLDRQYIVRIGNGTVSQNILSSDAWGAKMHIPLHSNAEPWDCMSPYNTATFGTWGMYVSTNGSQLADQLRLRIGPSSPGTNDKIVKRTDLGELNETNAVAAYLEAEFHTYGLGWPWLHDYESWDWRLGYAVDVCRGYPRDSNGDKPTAAKSCSW